MLNRPVVGTNKKHKVCHERSNSLPKIKFNYQTKSPEKFASDIIFSHCNLVITPVFKEIFL